MFLTNAETEIVLLLRFSPWFVILVSFFVLPSSFEYIASYFRCLIITLSLYINSLMESLPPKADVFDITYLTLQLVIGTAWRW